MTDNLTEQKTTANHSNMVNHKKRRSWAAAIALLAIIAAITCWFQLVHQQKKTTNNYSQLQSSFHQTLSDTAQLSQTIEHLQNQISNQNEQIQALQSGLNRMQAANSGYETDLTLQQVDRYLLQANLSLVFNHDINSSIHLLQAADQRLNLLPEAQIVPLRQQIATDIIKLQSIPALDLVGILSKLSALRDQAASAPLFAINTKTQIFHPTQESSASTNIPATTKYSVWKKTWQTTLETLRSLVIIRNRQNEIMPLISNQQEQFLRQNLQLIFQQTQWAVLQHQNAVYQYNLTQATEWIQRYFADNDQATIAMQTEINELQNINLSPQTPDLSTLIEQLHSIQLVLTKDRSMDNPVITQPTTETKQIPTIEIPQPLKNQKSPDTKGELV